MQHSMMGQRQKEFPRGNTTTNERETKEMFRRLRKYFYNSLKGLY